MDLRETLRENWEHRRVRWIGRGRDRVFIEPLLEAGRAQPAHPYTPRQRLRRHLMHCIMREIDRGGVDEGRLTVEPRTQLRRLIELGLDEAGLSHLEESKRAALEGELVAELRGLGPLDALVSDPTISDILINGPYDIWVDRCGRLERTGIAFDDEAHLLRLLNRLVAGHGRHIEEATPYVDVRLADGSRLHAMIPPLSALGPVVAIRRSRAVPLRLEQLFAAHSLTSRMAEFLGAAVSQGCNILVSGGASTGKTTLLNILSQFIPPEERVVTIEETAELRFVHPHVIALETRMPNVEGRGGVDLRTLLRNALRLRADRIIVGEVRGPEVFDMLQAMNLGHHGSLTTVHANSADDALRRLEHLVLLGGFDLPNRAIREMVGAAIDLVVHLVRLPNGDRRVASISEVVAGQDSLAARDIFRFRRDAGLSGRDSEQHVLTGYRPTVVDRLRPALPAVEDWFADEAAAPALPEGTGGEDDGP